MACAVGGKSSGVKKNKTKKQWCHSDYCSNKSDSYSFRLCPQVIQQLLVFHGGGLPFGLYQLSQGLGHLLPALAGRGAHTCNRERHSEHESTDPQPLP